MITKWNQEKIINDHQFSILRIISSLNLACPLGQQLHGVECQKVAHWGQPCEKDTQCIDVFNQCVGGICQCTPGSSRDLMRQACIAGAHLF